MSIKGLIKNQLSEYLIKKYSKRALIDDRVMLASYPRKSLTKEELNEVNSLWGGLHPKIGMSVPYYEIQKAITGFDPRLVAGPVYYPRILRALNPSLYYKALTHKSMSRYMLGDLPQPVTIASDINGCMLDKDKHQISKNDLAKLLSDSPDDYIIKASIDSCGGKGVKFIHKADKSHIKSIIDSFGKNFIVQEILKGSQEIERLNPSSLNTFRISTLLLNGELSLCSSGLRIGAEGQECDNLCRGGLMIGIDNATGRLKKYGLTIDGYRVTERNGITFHGYKIPNFEKIIEAAFDGHRRIAICALASWDFALDEYNEPCFIEVNLYWPGIRMQQLASGPLFLDRTQEVIEYVSDYAKKKKFYFIGLSI